MSHSNNRFNNRIWTNESVYRDSPIGNLERIMVSGISPLQQGFYGNIEACLPIGIDFNSAFLASEQGIVSTVMSLPNSTAVGTELGRMPRINDIQHNILVKTSLFEILPESKERNTHNLTIESFALRTESLEVLNGNVSIISQSHFSNIPNDFSYSILDKVMFISFSPVQCLIRMGTSSISITLQNRFPFKQLSSSLPDVLPEVILMQNHSFWGKDSNGKAFAVHINSKNVLLQRQFSTVFGKISDNLKSGSKSVGLANPSVLQKVGVSLEVPILFYGNSNSVSWINSKFDERHSHVKGLAISRNIEFDSNSFGYSSASPNSAFQTGVNLNIESGSSFGFSECLSMEIHKGIAEVPIFPESIEFRSRFQREVFEYFALFGSNLINLQKNSTFHTTNQICVFGRIYITNTRQFIPPLKSVGFLVGDR